ncbi:hypothetical protein JCM8097_001060 [Rhodosporidiobolus ruineniae]
MPSTEMESTKPSTTDEPVDYFSFLPLELLRRIFELAYAKEAPPGPLSKALLPFFLELVYKGISINSYFALERFSDHIRQYPERGPLVKSLKIAVSEKTGRWAPALPDKPPSSSIRLEALFDGLETLGFLSIDEASPVVSFLLNAATARGCLTRIVKLSIENPMLDLEAPFHLSHDRALVQYPSLVQFHLVINRHSHAEVGIPEVEPLYSSPTFNNLTTLKLSSDNLDRLDGGSFLRSCPRLESLSLHDEEYGYSDLVALLPHLPNPHQLKHLALHNQCDAEDGYDLDVVPFLHSAPALESLYIGGSAELSASFFAWLPSLTHLHALNIGINTIVDAAAFLHFLRGESHPSLRTLYLGNLVAYPGVKFGEPNWQKEWLVEWGGEIAFPHSWWLARWDVMEGWTPEIVKEIRQAADATSLDVSGSTFKALEVEEQYEAEFRKVEDCLEEAKREQKRQAREGWQFDLSGEAAQSSDEDEDMDEDEDEDGEESVSD